MPADVRAPHEMDVPEPVSGHVRLERQIGRLATVHPSDRTESSLTASIIDTGGRRPTSASTEPKPYDIALVTRCQPLPVWADREAVDELRMSNERLHQDTRICIP